MGTSWDIIESYTVDTATQYDQNEEEDVSDIVPEISFTSELLS